MSYERNIQSSDNRLARKVQNALKEANDTRLESIDCESNGSTLVLSGQLGSYYELQVVHSILESVPYVETIIDQIEIVPSVQHVPK